MIGYEKIFIKTQTFTIDSNEFWSHEEIFFNPFAVLIMELFS